MLTNIYKKGGAVQIHHHHPNRLKTKKNLQPEFIWKEKKKWKTVGREWSTNNDGLLILICCDDAGGYIAAKIFDAHYLVVWWVR
jgi:hypothetical protein